jgi:hypothetical protein
MTFARKRWDTRTFGFALSLAAASGGLAQVPGPSQTGLSAAMLKLFGSTAGFSAKAEVRLLDAARKETLQMQMDFAVLTNKVRAEVDMSQIKSVELSAEDLAGFKEMGMDRVITVVRPDRKSALIIYPSLRGYVEAPMAAEEAAAWARNYRVQKTRLGKEAIESRMCERSKVIVTSDDGERHDAMVWYAADLKNFPVQIQMNQPDATVTFRFREIRQVHPDAAQFEAPAGFAKHDNLEKLVRSRAPPKAQ